MNAASMAINLILDENLLFNKNLPSTDINMMPDFPVGKICHTKDNDYDKFHDQWCYYNFSVQYTINRHANARRVQQF